MKSILITQKLIMAMLAVLILGAGLLATVGQAQAQPSWMPNPPKAVAGSKCDMDPKEMRKSHMTVLGHKRDETMHDGIRTKKYSLKRCITCHAVKDETNKYVTVKDERHFCRTCHDYTAVRIDCFDCHASRPDEKMNKSAKAAGNPHNKAARSSSPLVNMDTALATLQKFIAGEGK